MSEQQYGEKYEKEEEKSEKEREKEQEKSWDEKWRRDPVGAVVWAFILMWAGAVLLAENLGYLAQFEQLDSVWSIILFGAGAIVLLGIAVRLVVPAYRRSIGGDLILATVLIGVGLGDIFGWSIVLPLVLIAIGLGALLRGIFR